MEIWPAVILPPHHSHFERLTREELHQLADGLVRQDVQCIDTCVAFITAETRGLWHGRARALMCRRLRHCALGRTYRTRLVDSITARLTAGRFSQQFKEQPKLALELDRAATLASARWALAHGRPHVVRYAQWVLSHAQP